MFARSTPARLMCTAEGTAGDAPPEGLSKSALKKLKKQQEQAARKAEKKAQKAAAAEAEVATAEADSAEEPPASYSFGDDGVLMSDTSVLASPRTYTPVRTLGAEGGAAVGEEVWVRGRLFRLRAKGNQCFLVVRSGGFFTVQACFFKDKETPRQSKEMLSWLSELTAESIIDVRGELGTPSGAAHPRQADRRSTCHSRLRAPPRDSERAGAVVLAGQRRAGDPRGAPSLRLAAAAALRARGRVALGGGGAGPTRRLRTRTPWPPLSLLLLHHRPPTYRRAVRRRAVRPAPSQVTASEATERPFARIGQELRLNNRCGQRVERADPAAPAHLPAPKAQRAPPPDPRAPPEPPKAFAARLAGKAFTNGKSDLQQVAAR